MALDRYTLMTWKARIAASHPQAFTQIAVVSVILLVVLAALIVL
jgi:hypothetical protein